MTMNTDDEPDDPWPKPWQWAIMLMVILAFWLSIAWAVYTKIR